MFEGELIFLSLELGNKQGKLETNIKVTINGTK